MGKRDKHSHLVTIIVILCGSVGGSHRRADRQRLPAARRQCYTLHHAGATCGFNHTLFMHLCGLQSESWEVFICFFFHCILLGEFLFCFVLFLEKKKTVRKLIYVRGKATVFPLNRLDLVHKCLPLAQKASVKREKSVCRVPMNSIPAMYSTFQPSHSSPRSSLSF